MRKIYKLLGVLALSVPFFGNAQVSIISDFESGMAPWTSTGFGTTTTSSCAGQSIRDNIYSSVATMNVTAPTATAAGGDINISFDYKIVNYSSPYPGTPATFGSLTLEHSIDGGTTFTVDTVIDNTNHVVSSSCATVTTTTTAAEVPSGSNVIYRFRANWSTGDYWVYLDNINIIEVVSCPQPFSAVLDASTATSATFSWTNTAPEYQFSYGGVGTAAGSGTLVTTTTNPGTITGLTPSTAYDVYIRNICTPGTDTSAWTGPISITTPCLTYTAPYVESFDTTAIPDCWTMFGPEDWKFGGTWPAYGANGVTDHTGNGGHFAGVDGSSGTNFGVTLASPMVDVSTLTHPMIEFYYFSNNTNYPGDNNTLHVAVWDGAAWDTVRTIAEDNPDWKRHQISLAGLTITGDIQVRFIVDQTSPTSAYYNDQLIDDVAIKEAPSCFSPTGLASTIANTDTIAIAWTAGYNETEWEVQYGTGGFTLGTGTTVSTNATGDTLLNPTGIVTEFYVRAVCGAGDSSEWTGPLQVVLPVTNDTMCAAIAIPTDLSTGVYSTIGAGNDNIGGNNLYSAVWFKTAVPASGNLAVNTCGSQMPGVALRVFTSSDCSVADSAVQVGYASHGTNPFSCSASGRAGIELCGLTPGDTVYIAAYRPYSWSSYPEGIFNIQAWDPTYGSGTVTDFVACYTDSVNLQGQVTGQSTNPYANFVWNYPNNPSAIANDTIFVAGNATPAGDSLFYYPTNGCSRDTIGLMLEVKEASNAGTDGTMPACKGQQINLLEGLGGTVDFGGTWYNPSNTALPSGDIISGAIPGSYNYTYVTNNGYCSNDTSVVTVVVSDCWPVGIEEVELANVSIFPNPTNETVYITNFGSNEVFNFEVVDLNGRVVTSQENAINGTETTEVSLSNVEKGIYLVRIFNGTAEKTYRVVKQ